jgi:thiamine pyrophosphokinase
MNKPLDSCFKYFFLSNPPLDLFQNLNSLSLGGVKYPLKNSASSGLLQGSYIRWK